MQKLPVIDSGHVANCAATDCGFNRNRTCNAPNGIQVVFHSDHADCKTYTRDMHKAG